MVGQFFLPEVQDTETTVALRQQVKQLKQIIQSMSSVSGNSGGDVESSDGILDYPMAAKGVDSPMASEEVSINHSSASEERVKVNHTTAE